METAFLASDGLRAGTVGCMRRGIAIAVFLAAVALPLHLEGQARAVGRMSTGGMRVTRAPGVFRGPVGRGFPGATPGPFQRRVARRGVFISPGSFAHRGFHNRFFFSACFNSFDPFFCNNALFFRRAFFPGFLPYAYAYPYYPPDYGYNMGGAAAAPQYAADNSYQQGVEQGRLEAEVSGLREDVSRLTDELARSRAAGPAYAPAEKSAAPALPTVLVYRDGHRREIQDYAIVGQTLWILSAHTAARVPLAQLDLEATRKVNDERGTEFQLP